MKNYLKNQNEKTKKYYQILSKEFPEFLNDYIYTPEMQKLEGINQICGGYWRKENIYEDIQIVQNENNIPELGFNSIEMAEKFVIGASRLWPLWVSAEDTMIMYFFADIIEKMYNEKYITKKDLYELSEKEIINLIKNCKDGSISERFNRFMKCNNFIETEEYKNDKFCVSRKVKRRYINPLTQKGRIYDISSKSKEIIDEYINMKISKYVYVNI